MQSLGELPVNEECWKMCLMVGNEQRFIRISQSDEQTESRLTGDGREEHPHATVTPPTSGSD